MNNKAHTILVSVIASYGSRLTTSTANCKAFLADFLSEYTEEKNVLVELHQLQLTKALYTFKAAAIDKKTLINFIDQLETQTKIAKHDLAWGVDAWANAVDLDLKSRRMIRKQCFSNALRDLHTVNIRPIEVAPESAPEVPAMVVENANQAALPRIAVMGVVTLVSTFSIFQAVKSMLPSSTASTPTAIEEQLVVKESPASFKPPLPKLVVIKSRDAVATESVSVQTAQGETVGEERPHSINVEQLSSPYIAEEITPADSDISIDFAEAQIEKTLPEMKDDKLHADIEAFLTQDQ